MKIASFILRTSAIALAAAVLFPVKEEAAA